MNGIAPIAATPIPGFIPSGSVGTPGLRFREDADSGLYRIGANNIGMALGGVKAWDFAATATSFTGANSTSNTTLTVENTSNAAAASHAIIEAKVGGAVSTGDPQVRFTVPSGRSVVMGVDNDDSDAWVMSVGTALGTANILRCDTSTDGATDTITTMSRLQVAGLATTLRANASANLVGLLVSQVTATLSGQTQITALMTYATVQPLILSAAAATIVDKATGFDVRAPTPGSNVTLTEGRAFTIRNTNAAVGTYTRQAGLVIEALTAGVTNPQILLYNGSTEHTTAVADTCSISVVDVGAAAVFSLTSETAVVTPAGDFALTSKLIARINGVTYAIGMTTVLT